MSKEAEEDSRSWHVSKNVPLALIGFLMVQSVAIGYWGASIDSNVAKNAAAIEAAHVTAKGDNEFHTAQRIRVWNELNGVANSMQTLGKEISKLEGTLSQMDKTLQRSISTK